MPEGLPLGEQAREDPPGRKAVQSSSDPLSVPHPRQPWETALPSSETSRKAERRKRARSCRIELRRPIRPRAVRALPAFWRRI